MFSLPAPEQRVPRSCVLGKGGYDGADSMWFVMPIGLHRSYGARLRKCKPSWYPPFAKNAKERGTHFAGRARRGRRPGPPAPFCREVLRCAWKAAPLRMTPSLKQLA